MHKIFGYFLKRAEDSTEDVGKRIAYASWFLDSFPEEEFVKTERLFFKMLELSVKFAIPLTEKYIRTYIASEMRNYILKSKIKVEGTEELNNFEDLVQLESLVARTKDVILGNYYDLLNEAADIDEFIAEADMFMSERLDERVMDILQKSYEMRSAMVDGKTGIGDASNFLVEETSYVTEVYDKEKLEELASDTLMSQGSMLFVTDTGIPGIDSDTLGGHAGQMYGIEAGPGIGKTRFACGVWTYRAAVYHKKDVAYFALEQSKKEIEALLIARHFYELYSEEMDSKLILFDKVPEKYKKKVIAAKMDLFESGKYGKIFIRAGAMLYLENFIDKIKMLDKLQGPFDMIVIDYMGLLEQKPRKKNEYTKELQDYEIIKRGYKKFKRYLMNSQKFGIAVNQLNAKGAEKAKKGQDVDTMDAQGGMEVYRSTDYNMTIIATPEMEAKKVREITSPKKRNSEGIGRILCRVRMACCLWVQAETTSL